MSGILVEALKFRHLKPVDASYVALIHSSRVLPATRSVLLERLDSSFEHYEPQVMTSEEFQTLTALTARLLPAREGEPPIPYAAMIDQALHQGKGKGWRYADLPPDREAIRSGLQFLHCDALREYACAFVSLNGERQDGLLKRIQDAEPDHWLQFPARRWFEEILAITTELFMTSPESYSAIGYSGIANVPAWKSVALDSAEPWEPRAKDA